MENFDMQITNEQVSPGVFPQWLYNHIISEISDPLTYSKGGPSKLLVVYPNDESKVEILSRLSNDGFVIDRNLHHTISSLMISIMNDFRMPQLLKNDAFFDLIIHDECTKESKKLEIIGNFMTKLTNRKAPSSFPDRFEGFRRDPFPTNRH